MKSLQGWGLPPSHEATGSASRELGQGGDKEQDLHFPMCFNLSLNKASSDTVGLVSLVPGRRRHLLRDQAHWVSEVPLRERVSSRQGPREVVRGNPSMVVSVCSLITAKVQAFFLKASCKSTSFLQGAFSSLEQMRAVLRSAACVFQLP